MADEFTKVSGYLNREFTDKLLTDLLDFNIFYESDMQACTYHYLREFFKKYRHPDWMVRSQPYLAKTRPDICIFRNYSPIYLIEFKFFDADPIKSRLNDDIEKLKELKKHYDSVRKCFIVFIYDSDEMLPELTSYRRKKLNLQDIYIVPINARRKRESKRHRPRYDDWKKQWLRFKDRQK